MEPIKARRLGYFVGEWRGQADEPHADPKERIFWYIVEYKRNHDGNSPTMREIMVGCGISTTSMVYLYLNQMKAAGLIRRPEPESGIRCSASIEVVGGEWTFDGGGHVNL
jgi:hypothetical protein